MCSVYEKSEGDVGTSKAELIEAYQKLMTLFPRLALSGVASDFEQEGVQFLSDDFLYSAEKSAE